MRMSGDGAVARVVTGRVEGLVGVLGKLRQCPASLVVGDGRSNNGSAILIIGGSWKARGSSETKNQHSEFHREAKQFYFIAIGERNKILLNQLSFKLSQERGIGDSEKTHH